MYNKKKKKKNCKCVSFRMIFFNLKKSKERLQKFLHLEFGLYTSVNCFMNHKLWLNQLLLFRCENWSYDWLMVIWWKIMFQAKKRKLICSYSCDGKIVKTVFLKFTNLSSANTLKKIFAFMEESVGKVWNVPFSIFSFDINFSAYLWYDLHKLQKNVVNVYPID